MAKLLIVEDDKEFSESLREAVMQYGYAADCVFDGKAAEERLVAESDAYEAVILDLILPHKDGFAVCKNVREKKITIPILILSARNAIDYKVTALDAGADDYLTKPFSTDELMARLRALFRRPRPVLSARLQSGPLVLETLGKKAFLDGQSVQFGVKEFMLLECLLRHPRMVVSRKQLIETAWRGNEAPSPNAIDAHIKNIRRKLHPYGDTLLKTVHRVGYRVDA